MATISSRTIAVLVGSSRQNGNGLGIARWVSASLKNRLDVPRRPVDVLTVDPAVSPHPFGPVVDGTRLPSQINDPSLYSSPAIRDWSSFISSCSAFAVISPEYNGGYPGELKNSLDHLYNEWVGKPVLLVTYGGGGAKRAGAQLQTVLSSLKLQVLSEPLTIKLPASFIRGEDRVGEPAPEFLVAHEEQLRKAIEELDVRLSSASVS